MSIFDQDTMKEILRVTCCILKNNFYYSKESLHEFLDIFAKEAAKGLRHFALNAQHEILYELYRDQSARIYFTCYITSAYLRDIFINVLFFTDKELIAFESIIPKCR